MMKRRTYFLGLAAGTSGAASVLGTSAFTTARLKRQVSIKVVPDNQGLIGLKVPYSGSAIKIDEKKLIIDAAEEGDDEGIKAGTTRGFGDWNPSGKVKTAALRVVNQGSQPQSIEFKYSWAPDEIGDSSMEWFFSWQPTGQNKKHFVVDDTREEASITARNITPGDAINIAFRVDAAEAGDILSGEISLESETVEDEEPSPSNSDK